MQTRSDRGGARARERRALFTILGVGVAAMLLVVLTWVLLIAPMGNRPGNTAQRPVATGTTSAGGQTIAATSSGTFSVPVPSYVTPTLSQALGTQEPALPEASAIITPNTAPPPPPPPAGPQISNVGLGCELQGNRKTVKATLRLTSTTPVPVTVTAGGKTEKQTVNGSASITVATEVKDPRDLICSGTINGQQVGPIAAR